METDSKVHNHNLQKQDGVGRYLGFRKRATTSF